MDHSANESMARIRAARPPAAIRLTVHDMPCRTVASVAEQPTKRGERSFVFPAPGLRFGTYLAEGVTVHIDAYDAACAAGDDKHITTDAAIRCYFEGIKQRDSYPTSAQIRSRMQSNHAHTVLKSGHL